MGATAMAYSSAYIRMMDEFSRIEEKPRCFSVKEDTLPDYEVIWEDSKMGSVFTVYYRDRVIDCFPEDFCNLTDEECRTLAKNYLLNIVEWIEFSNHMMEYSHER